MRLGFVRIRGQLLFYFLVVGLIFGAIVAAISYVNASNALVSEAFDAVDSLGLTRELQLVNWVDGIVTDITALSSNEQVIVAARAFRNTFDTSQEVGVDVEDRVRVLRDVFLNNPDLVDAEELSSPYRAIHERFHTFFRSTQLTYGYSDIYLVNVNGDVIYSSAKNDDVFTNVLSGSYSDTGLSSVVSFVLEGNAPEFLAFVDFEKYSATGEATAFIGHSLFDRGENLGVLVVALPIDLLGSILNQDLGFGETGETYVVGSDQLLRSDIAIEEISDSAVLNPSAVISTEPVDKALAGESGIGFTENYDAVPVLSSWKSVELEVGQGPDVVWALISEISVSEAIAPANQLVIYVLIGMLVAIGIVFVVSYFLASQISSPIVELTSVADRIAQGDYSVPVTVRERTEIGQLANSIVDMRSQIRDSFDLLERRVAERTRDLEVAADVSRYAAEVLDLDKLLSGFVSRMRRSFNSDAVSVFLYSEGNTEISLVASHGKSRIKALDDPVALVEYFAAVEVGYNQEVSDDMREVLVPMVVAGSMIGFLVIELGMEQQLTQENIGIFYSLGNQLGVAIQNARSYAEQFQVAEELKKLDTLKSQFLARMSHELRTPLNSVLNFTRFTVEGFYGDINDVQKEFLQRSIQSAEDLLALINDVLDISKIEAGMMQLFVEEAVDVHVLLDEVVVVAETLVAEKPLAIKTEFADSDLHVLGDRRRLKQVLLNLVSNACKFTQKGSVTVACEVVDKNLVVRVIDTGIGIRPDYIDRIFEPFEQVESAISDTPGTGLGLPISKKLAEAHYGSLTVFSEYGKGSCFILSIPVSAPELERLMEEQVA